MSNIIEILFMKRSLTTITFIKMITGFSVEIIGQKIDVLVCEQKNNRNKIRIQNSPEMGKSSQK